MQDAGDDCRIWRSRNRRGRRRGAGVPSPSLQASTWWVCVELHSNFGEFWVWAVSEGVTNQSPETGINYANSHLAMGQMTPILFKSTSPGAHGVTAPSPGFAAAPGEDRSGWAACASCHTLLSPLAALPAFQFPPSPPAVQPITFWPRPGCSLFRLGGVCVA